MNRGLVFILYGPKDEDYAVQLAAAVVPLFALPMAFSSNDAVRQTEYGAGATCVVLLSDGLQFRSELLAKALPRGSTVICSRPGVAMPRDLARYTKVLVGPDLEATASVLREAVAAKQSEQSAEVSRSRRATSTPSLSETGSEAREPGKHAMVVRSVWGLAATIAVASIAAPAIGGRAGASSVGSNLDVAANRANEASVLRPDATSSATPSVDEEDVQAAEPPHLVALLDHLDRTERVEAATIVAYAPAESLPASGEPISPENQFVVGIKSEADPVATVDAIGGPKRATEPTAVDTKQADRDREAEATRIK